MKIAKLIVFLSIVVLFKNQIATEVKPVNQMQHKEGRVESFFRRHNYFKHAPSKYQKSTKSKQKKSGKQVSLAQYKLNQALRKLWAEHSIWTRLYILVAIADGPNKKLVLETLLKNQDQLGDAIVPYYGKEAGSKLAKLLREHIVLAGDILEAAKANNENLVKEKDKEWHKNAEDIAEFLSKANPNLPKQTLINMLNKHLELVTNEVTYLLKKEWEKDVSNFKENFDQVLEMADALTDGIVKQFPDKF